MFKIRVKPEVKRYIGWGVNGLFALMLGVIYCTTSETITMVLGTITILMYLVLWRTCWPLPHSK